MMRALNQLIIRVSSSGWLFALSAALMFGSLWTLMQIGAQFRALTGVEPFDLQNGLTTGQVLEQLPLYSGQVRQLYFRFTAVDYLFPLAAGLFQAGMAAFCLRLAFPGVYAGAVRRQLLPLLLLASLFDWCENIAAVTAINAWPDTSSAMATALVTAKKLKLGFLMLTQALVLLLMLAAAITWLRRRFGPGRP